MQEVMNSILEQPHVALAADWNPWLSDDVCIIYRCDGCHICPMNQGKWLRMVKTAYANAPGGSTTHGKWKCAAKYDKGACLKEFEHSGSSMALVLLNLSEELTDGNKYQIVFIGGDTGDFDEQIITQLKAAKLLVTSDKKTDKTALLEAIEKLNAQCENRLISLAESRSIRSCTMADIQEKGLGGVPYCEDARLSIQTSGSTFIALYVPPETQYITKENRIKLYDVLSYQYDLSALPRPNGPVAKAAYDFLRFHTIPTGIKGFE